MTERLDLDELEADAHNPVVLPEDILRLIAELRAEREAHERLKKAAVDAKEFIEAVREFRTSDGDCPLGVCDYYRIDALLDALSAALVAKEPKP